MAVIVDLTKQNCTTKFEGSSEEDISYATNFWQSIQLHPPMESRLVSSDIKQRLKVAPASSQARQILASRQEDFNNNVLQDFMSRARTIEHMDEYARIQKFVEAKSADKELMVKHRDIRIKKEEVSRNKGIKPIKNESPPKPPKEEYCAEEENIDDVCNQINQFESDMFGNTGSDSD